MATTGKRREPKKAAPRQGAAAPEAKPREVLERVESGIPRLDFILKGGFFRGGTYTLYGPPEHRDGLVHDTYAQAARRPEPFDGRLSE